jgi:drug/metabolite transporter (DMT)-like permease
MLMIELLVAGALNLVFPFLLFAYGNVAVSVGVASIFVSTTPILVLLITQFLLWRNFVQKTEKNSITIRKVIGILLGFLGVCLSSAWSISSQLHSGPIAWFYVVFIAGVVCQGFGVGIQFIFSDI